MVCWSQDSIVASLYIIHKGKLNYDYQYHLLSISFLYKIAFIENGAIYALSIIFLKNKFLCAKKNILKSIMIIVT